MVSKLELRFWADLKQMPEKLLESYVDEVARLTCSFGEGASLEEAVSKN